MLRRRGTWLVRLLHHGDEPVRVAVRPEGPGRIVLLARAATPAAAEHGIARVRFALGVDDDLREFRPASADDPLLGPARCANPALRSRRRAAPLEALAWAMTEQLIEDAGGRRAAAAGRPLGPPSPSRVHCDVPSAHGLSGAAPGRARGLRPIGRPGDHAGRAAREVAAGRADLAPRPAPAERRLRAIPGIGRWTVDCLALHGQGRHDVLPAGDLVT